LPFSVADTPVFEDWTITLAKGMPSPFSFVILPEICRFWLIPSKGINKRASNNFGALIRHWILDLVIRNDKLEIIY
jgi:hypothetical protein